MGFDASKLGQMIAASQGQKVIKGVQKTKDPDFPVFGTPVDKDILIYIPRTNITSDENGETMGVLHSVIHDYKEGRQFGSLRCIKGLDNEVFSELGYDGECPLCKALNECWALYNQYVDLKAKQLNLKKNADGTYDDPEELLKPYKEQYRKEMAINQPTEYVTFPIVVIPKAPAAAKPAEGWEKEAKAYWLHWRRERYEEKILKQLDSLDENPGHPAGLIWLAKYTYDTKGAKADPMLAAKNATYSICQNQSKFEDVMRKGEELAREFTIQKAVETVIAVDFKSVNEIERKLSSIMKDTRNKLAILSGGGADSTANKAIENDAEKALEQFGVTDVKDTPNEAPADNGGDLGVDDMGASPVKFD